MKEHITLYTIPDRDCYIDRNSLFGDAKTKYIKTNNIDHNVPTVCIINDSFYHYGKEFMVIYQGRIYPTGGGGSCYNPKFVKENPNDWSVKHIQKDIKENGYWGKPFTYNPQYIYSRICAAKYHLLEKMGLRNQLPFWYWDIEEFQTGMFGVLIAKLDAIGMGHADCSIIKEYSRHNIRKALC